MSNKQLLKISVFYLLCPAILFLYYWIYAPLNLFLIVILLGYCTYYYITLQKTAFSADSFSIKELSIIFILAFLWTIFTGIGGFVWQKEDFYLHHTKFTNLFNSSWPLKNESNNQYIIYYFGYYLVPSFISKKINYFSNAIVVAWSVIGFFLASAWLYLLMGKKTFRVLLLLGSGGVAQLLYYYVFYSLLNTPYPKYPTFPMSLYEQSEWVPNQVIPAIICGAIAIYLIEHKLSLKWLILPACLSFLWGIFPIIILILLLLVWLFYKKEYQTIIESTTFGLIPIMAIAVPLLIYYSSSGGNDISGFIWNFNSVSTSFGIYFRQVLPDALCIFILIHFLYKEKETKELAYLSLFFYLALGLLRIGLYNDLFHRAIIILYIFIFYAIFKDFELKISLKNSAVIALILLNLGISLKDLSKKVYVNIITHSPEKVAYAYYLNDTIYDAFVRINLLQGAIEYSSKDKNSPYEKYLAPKK